MTSQHTNEDVSRRQMLSLTAAALGAAAIAGPAAGQAVPAAGLQAGFPVPNGKAALVTGSSRGIGAAIARRLARDGYDVMVNCVTNRDLAAGIVREIEAAGGRATWIQADVSDRAAVRRLFDFCEEAFGGVDVVVNNAGIMRLAPFAEMTDADFDRQLAVNVVGGFNVLREAARRVRDGGRIISLSSTITELKTATYGPYAGTKAALQAFTGCLAKELRGRGISVTAVAPGVVNTPLFTDGKTPEQIAGFAQRTPHGRLGEPDDIAAMVAALAGPDGAWTNGTTVFVHGGLV